MVKCSNYGTFPYHFNKSKCTHIFFNSKELSCTKISTPREYNIIDFVLKKWQKLKQEHMRLNMLIPKNLSFNFFRIQTIIKVETFFNQ